MRKCWWGEDFESLAKVIDESMRTNDSQPLFVPNRICEIMEENGITDNEIVKNQVLDCFTICPLEGVYYI